jgi:hypothetical protein
LLTLFESAMDVVLGRKRPLFWKDHWLNGKLMLNIVRNLVPKIATRQAISHSVKKGLPGEWLRDRGLDLGATAVPEFFHLWHVLFGEQLIPDQHDAIVRQWNNDGEFSANSAYSVFFAEIVCSRFGAQGPL